MAAPVWTFTQVEGNNRKTLVLVGYQAPFGRPRKEPVAREVIKSRTQVKHYPGSMDGPMRTAFGTHWETMELKGRWMTKRSLEGGETAISIADDWTLFVRDERVCRVSWGNIISWRCFIEELELARESQNEIAWRMKIQVDKREDIRSRPTSPIAAPIQDDLKELQAFVKSGEKQLESLAPNMGFDFLDKLDAAAALFNYPSAVLNKAIGEITDIQRRTTSTLAHFRSGVTGMHSALIGMRDLLLNTAIDSVMVVRNAKSDVLWWKYQTEFDYESAYMLSLLGQMERRVELELKSEASKLITAKEGDTWETLAVRALNNVGRAADLRALNGARYGEQPTPSESYLVPT